MKRVLYNLVLLGLIAVLPVPAKADAQVATSVRSKLESLRGRVTVIDAELSSAERALEETLQTSTVSCIENKFAKSGVDEARCGRVDEKVSEGQIFMNLGDYEHAAVVLFDAVETPGFDRSMLYDEAVFSLAESLYRSDNFVGARSYYRLLIQRQARMYVQPSIVRLIEIAGRMNDYTNIDVYYEAYQKLTGSTQKPEITYVHAKYLMRVGRYDDARRVLGAIAPAHALGHRALYLQAVATLASGGEQASKNAIDIFARVASLRPRDAAEREVQELAYLAQGRIYYEIGELGRSADAYQNIPIDSPHFNDMLFEVAWTFIKRGQTMEDKQAARVELRKALQALDLIVVPGSRLEPEVAILRGNLNLKLGNFDKSKQAFDGVLSSYRPTVGQLEQLMHDRGDASRLLEDILAADEKDLSVNSLLPPLAAKWAHGKEEIDEALRVYRELRTSKKEVAAAREVIGKLNRVLDASNRAEILPQVSELHTRGMTVRDQLLDLNTETARLLGHLLKADDVPGYFEAVEHRKNLEKKFSTIPKTRAGLAKRVNRINARIASLEREVFKVSLTVDQQNAQVASINKWLVDQKAEGKLDPADEELWRSMLDQTSKMVEELDQEQKILAEQLRRERDQLTVSGGEGSQEDLIRQELQAALRREAELSAKVRAKASGGALETIGLIDQETRKIDALMQRADRFQLTLGREVNRYTEALRRAIAVEEGKLDRYEREVLRYQNEAGDVAAGAASLALRGVRDDFYDFVLRADVGVIDMAWQRKKEKSDEISAMVKRQRNELKALDVEFGEVLQGDD